MITIFVTDTQIGLASFGTNIQNLAIVDSSFLDLKPSNFDSTFSPQALVLLNSIVTASLVRYSVREGFLFQPKHPMYLLRVEHCQIETSERMTFVKANAQLVNISDNVLTLDGALTSSIQVSSEFQNQCKSPMLGKSIILLKTSRSSQVVGDNITFSRNMVISVEDNDVHLTTSHSLEIESNWSCNYIINILIL